MSSRKRKRSVSSSEESGSSSSKSSESESKSSSSDEKKKKKNGKKSSKKKSKGKNKKKKTKKKSKRRKGNNPYALYMKSERAKFAKDNPTASFGELAKIMGKHWKAMSKEDKQPYYDQAQKAKAEAAAQSSESSSSSSREKKPKKKKRKKDPNAPKMPINAFLFWTKENRNKVKEQHPDVEGKDVTKLCGKLWKALSEEDKKPYVEKYEKDLARYKKELEDYNNKQEKS